ncbi:MAG: hypothetical protein JSU64_03760, partial [candidate division WOR-3 bacterium]
MQAIVFDPDHLRLTTLTRDLREFGLHCTTTVSIDELRKIYRKKKFDILILDESALAILDQFRKQYEDIPVILIADRVTAVNFEKTIYAGIAG